MIEDTAKFSFEIGDSVRERGSQAIRVITGIGPGEFFMTQVGRDAGTVKPVKGADLYLIAKAPKPDTEPGLVPGRSITDVGY
jgi:hypothetical protein